MPLGRRVVIIGGGIVGLELAEFLVDRGRTVTVLEEKPFFAPQMAIPRRWRVLHHLRESGVSLIGGIHVKEITEQFVAFVTPDGTRKTVEADAVILAAGTVPNKDLSEDKKGLGIEFHLIGDCNEIGYIQGAMADGARIGNSI